jgi:cell division protein FtsW (lipid II flippase)
MAKADVDTPEGRAQNRVKSYTDAMWHIASFVIINAFLWFLDLRQAGADWAYWVTIVWGIGLAFHVAYYLIGDAGFENRRYRRFLAEEQDRQTRNPA